MGVGVRWVWVRGCIYIYIYTHTHIYKTRYDIVCGCVGCRCALGVGERVSHVYVYILDII